MEQPQYLIDTNAIVDYLGSKIPVAGMDFMNSIIDAVPNVSVVTKIEVLSFNAPDEHYQLLVNFMNNATILDLTGNIVETSIDILNIPYTSDFKKILGLQVVHPHSL